MKICGFLQVFNEVEKGNLRRCLDNLKKYCDYIVVYNDGSTDNSLEMAKEYAEIVIDGNKNDFLNETTHKQQLLDKTLKWLTDIDWFFWLDADEVLDRSGTEQLRPFLENADKEGYFCPELTLWRSQCYVRRDYLGYGKFLRAWKNNGNLRFNIANKLHAVMFPQGLRTTSISPFSVIHYGYATKKAIVDRWHERTRLGVPVNIRKKGLDESNMVLEHLSHNIFPKGCEPTECIKPKEINYGINI